MEKRFIPEIHLDKSSLIPLRMQLEVKLRRIILNERPEPGMRLISERKLAKKLEINRNTVHHAYTTLAKENLLIVSPQHGGGMLISEEARRFSHRPFPSICILLPLSFRESIDIMGGLGLIAGIMDRASECSVSVNVLSMPPPDADEQTVRLWMESFIWRSNGIITLGVRTKDFDPVFERLLENKNVPHVFLTGVSKLPHIGSVTVDYRAGMRQMLTVLRDTGHRNLLLVAEEDESRQFHNIAYDRAGMIRRYAGKYGIATQDCVIKKEFIPRNTAICPIADKVGAATGKIDAVWVNDSTIAANLYRELVRRGYRIPEDFSMIGNDMGKNEPFISSIDYDHFAAGAAAVDLIREMFDQGQSVPSAKRMIANSFVLRGSIRKSDKG